REPAFGCALFDDLSAPFVFEHKPNQTFRKVYKDHIHRQYRTTNRLPARLPYLQTVAERTVDSWNQSVLAAIRRLHGDHAWRHNASGKLVSFGLIRMANIKQAIGTAGFIATNQPNAKVACYHSQDFLIQRFLKERTLDHLLKRHQGNSGIEDDQKINAIVCNGPFDDIIFIVVATPVEEIGRDHDFDWAVIEPSSTRSIVQTAGRVNRHRHIDISKPNIAIMQFNHRWARGEKTVFCKPGFESGDSHDSHNLAELLNWSELSVIDAGLVFEQHRFAELDNAAIAKALETPLVRQFDLSASTPWWITQALYVDYPLRDQKRQEEYYLDADECFCLRYLADDSEYRWLARDHSITRIQAVCNDWLVYEHSELFDYCKAFDLSPTAGMRVRVDQENVIYHK
ncbi:MAG: hypothetical protein ACREO1_00965, partial [Arenimonas sp.]